MLPTTYVVLGTTPIIVFPVLFDPNEFTAYVAGFFESHFSPNPVGRKPLERQKPTESGLEKGGGKNPRGEPTPRTRLRTLHRLRPVFA